MTHLRPTYRPPMGDPSLRLQRILAQKNEEIAALEADQLRIRQEYGLLYKSTAQLKKLRVERDALRNSIALLLAADANQS